MTKQAAALVALLSVSVAGCSGTGHLREDPAPSVLHTTVMSRPQAGGAGGTTPTGWGPSVGEYAAARKAVAKMSDAELAGQVIVARYTGKSAPVRLVRKYHLGGVIVMGDNVGSVGSVIAENHRLQRSVHRRWPLVIAVDQEGGVVNRLGAPLTAFPTFMSYGAAGSPALARRAAKASGTELRAAGFTLVFAPDADVTTGPADPTIGSRSAGSRPNQVAAISTAALRGYVGSGIVPVAKHFPGHGSLTVDSHQALPYQTMTVKQLERRDFIPFRRAVRAGVPAIMMGHIALQSVDPGVPADLSRPDVRLLRDGFGFKGLISTDALEMAAVTDSHSAAGAAVDALRAGTDLVLMPLDLNQAYQGILDAMDKGTLSRARVRGAAARIVALMMHEKTVPVPKRNVIGSHQALSERVSAQALTVVVGSCRAAIIGPSLVAVGESRAVRNFDAAARRAGVRLSGNPDTATTVAFSGYGMAGLSADIVVTTDTPYALAHSSGTRIALFGATPEAMDALVWFLQGKFTARGRLPVHVAGVPRRPPCR